METAADAGRGVRGRYSTDNLVPDTFAGPYLFLEPDAYVLDNGERAVGYVIGTASTPELRRRVSGTLAAAAAGPVPAAVRSAVTEEEHRLDVMFHPGALAAARTGAAPSAPAHQPASRLPGVWPRAGADQHVPGLGGGRRGGIMLSRRPPGECERQALLRKARLAPGRGPRRGARDLPRSPDRLARTSPQHHPDLSVRAGKLTTNYAVGGCSPPPGRLGTQQLPCCDPPRRAEGQLIPGRPPRRSATGCARSSWEVSLVIMIRGSLLRSSPVTVRPIDHTLDLRVPRRWWSCRIRACPTSTCVRDPGLGQSTDGWSVMTAFYCLLGSDGTETEQLPSACSACRP